MVLVFSPIFIDSIMYREYYSLNVVNAQPLTNASNGTEEPERERGTLSFPRELVLIIGALIVVAVISIIIYRGKVVLSEGLTEEEREVLRIITRREGLFLQDLALKLGISQKELWRIIKGLKRKGYIDVEQRYGLKYVMLKK